MDYWTMEEVNLMSPTNCLARLVSAADMRVWRTCSGLFVGFLLPNCYHSGYAAPVPLQGGTSVYVLATCYLAGLLPVALSDWSNIIGVVCYIPLVWLSDHHVWEHWLELLAMTALEPMHHMPRLAGGHA